MEGKISLVQYPTTTSEHRCDTLGPFAVIGPTLEFFSTFPVIVPEEFRCMTCEAVFGLLLDVDDPKNRKRTKK